MAAHMTCPMLHQLQQKSPASFKTRRARPCGTPLALSAPQAGESDAAITAAVCRDRSRKTKIPREENLQHAPEHNTASRHAAHTSAAGLSCSLTLHKSSKSMNQSHSKQANGKYVNKSGISVSICRIWAVENEPESKQKKISRCFFIGVRTI